MKPSAPKDNNKNIKKKNNQNILIFGAALAVMTLAFSQREKIAELISNYKNAETSSDTNSSRVMSEPAAPVVVAPINKMDPQILKIASLRVPGFEECSQEISNLCKDVAPIAKMRHFCLLEHFESLSYECKAKLYAQKPKTKNVPSFSPPQVCMKKYAEFCPNITPNQIVLFYICHNTYWDKLPADCQKATSSYEDNVMVGEFPDQIGSISKCTSNDCRDDYEKLCFKFNKITEPGRTVICLLNQWKNLGESCKTCIITSN